MKITITGRKVSLRDNFKERVEKKLKKFGRMFGEDASASVTVTVEKRRQTVEVTIRTADGMVYRSEQTAPEMNDCLLYTSKWERRFRKKAKMGRS